MLKQYYGNYLGICINNIDPERRGRVQIFIPHIMPSLYEEWNKEGKDITIECVGNNLPNGLSKPLIDKLIKILPWAEGALPVVGTSVAGSYNPETGNFNQTDYTEGQAGAPAVPLSNSTDISENVARFTNGISFLETTNNAKEASVPNAGNTGFFQFNQNDADRAKKAGLPDPRQGTYAQQQQATWQYIQKFKPAAAAAIEKGDFKTATNQLNNFWVSLPGGSQATQRSDRYQEFNKILQGNSKYNISSGTQMELTDPSSGPAGSAVQPPNSPFQKPEGTSTYTTTDGQEIPTESLLIASESSAGKGSASVSRKPVTRNARGIPQTNGVINMTLPDGTKRSYQLNNGGSGSGAIPAGGYTVSNPRTRDTAGMVVDGVGYSFDLSDVYDSNAGRQRTDLRIHPDGGAVGTQGCLGIVGDAATQKQFYADMKAVLDSNGGKMTLPIKDDLPGSGTGKLLDSGASNIVKYTTPTTPVTHDTTGLPQGMFSQPAPGALLWVFFREGNPLFPVYFAASYGAAEWQAAQKGSSPVAHGPETSPTGHQSIFRPNSAGLLSFTGTQTDDKDYRAVRLAHANGGYMELHPTGSVHYSPNEHMEHVGGTNYSYCLNRESWTQGSNNDVTIGDQFIVIGNPTQANIETINKLTKKVEAINAEMTKK